MSLLIYRVVNSTKSGASSTNSPARGTPCLRRSSCRRARRCRQLALVVLHERPTLRLPQKLLEAGLLHKRLQGSSSHSGRAMTHAHLSRRCESVCCFMVLVRRGTWWKRPDNCCCRVCPRTMSPMPPALPTPHRTVHLAATKGLILKRRVCCSLHGSLARAARHSQCQLWLAGLPGIFRSLRCPKHSHGHLVFLQTSSSPHNQKLKRNGDADDCNPSRCAHS